MASTRSSYAQYIDGRIVQNVGAVLPWQLVASCSRVKRRIAGNVTIHRVSEEYDIYSTPSHDLTSGLMNNLSEIWSRSSGVHLFTAHIGRPCTHTSPTLYHLIFLQMKTNLSYRIAVPSSSVKHFASLARRLSRIFAHAYFHHRDIFEQAEAENALYERYATPLMTTPLIDFSDECQSGSLA